MREKENLSTWCKFLQKKSEHKNCFLSANLPLPPSAHRKKKDFFIDIRYENNSMDSFYAIHH